MSYSFFSSSKIRLPHKLLKLQNILGGLWVYSYRHRGFWLRCLLCWGIGCFALRNDEVSSYEPRFQLRGIQRASKDIILINLKPSDFITNQKFDNFGMMMSRDLGELTDSFYWDPKLWTELLSKLLAGNPRSIGISFYFGDSMGQTPVFKDPKVVWSAFSNYLEEPLIQNATTTKGTTVANSALYKEEDGIIRKFPFFSTEYKHLTEQISGRDFPNLESSISRTINYRGGPETFYSISLQDVFSDSLSNDFFKDKIIIIGPESHPGNPLLTPYGAMNRSEILANIVDNLVESRWIHRLDNYWYYVILFGVMLLSVYLISHYPQSIAFTGLILLSTLLSALSVWIFDTYYFWFPIISPLVMILCIWVVLIGYQATTIERKNWVLHREKKYLEELEQLKNNFISLISHDLKTPIAKIQAIVDRLTTNPKNNEIMGDLQALRFSGDELNKYIQSILKLLRVESRDFKIIKEVSDINEIIEDVLQQLRPLAVEKQITLDTFLEPMFSVEFDATLIREVILNLIENAIKYTPTNGVVKIESREVSNHIEVDITDNGEGIKSEDLKNIWGKFVRGSNQDLKSKGTGLGLYLVKYFIELHGGQVKLESQYGLGTKVGFSLPIDLDETEEESN